MSAVLPMFTEADVRRLSVGTPLFEERCEALLVGIRISRKGYLRAWDIDYDTLDDVVEYLINKGTLGVFHHHEDGECIGIRSQTGHCGPYTSGYCPLPGQSEPE